METAILVIWWIGLIGALILTVVILYEVYIILRALKDIHDLAKLTNRAARGIISNVEAESRLQALEEPLAELSQSTSSLRSITFRLASKLNQLAAGLEG